MFIVWGRKVVYRKLGYTADFCPICRKPRPFDVQRIGSAGHVYYISFGEGALVGFERTCVKCQTTFQAEPTQYVKLVPKLMPWKDLVRQTFPTLYEVYAERIALELQLIENPHCLPPQDRYALLRNPFLLLSPKVEKRFASTSVDKEVGFALLGAVGFLIVLPPFADWIAPNLAGAGVLVALVLGAVLVGWQAVQSGNRFMRKHIVPQLADALRPLQPTRSEMQAVLVELKSLRHKMGSKLNLPDLHAQLAQK